MRTQLPEFEREVFGAVKEFWERIPSINDAVMVCWTDQDDSLHGGFCEPCGALESIGEICELTDDGVSAVSEVLDKPQYLNTRIVRVLFVDLNNKSLQWCCCEEPRGQVGEA